MRIEVTQVSTNEYILDDFVQGDIPEKYLFGHDGEIAITGYVFDIEKAVHQLLQFIFQNKGTAVELYRDDLTAVLDLSSCRDQLIGFDDLDQYYQNWISETGREKTMDEYGMVLDFIGHAKRTMDKKYLLLVILNTR